jgi:hypothetical protein
MGSGFVWLSLSILFQLLLFLVWRSSKALQVSFKRIEKLQKSVFFTHILSTLVEGSLELAICGMVNVLNPNFGNNTEWFSTVFSIVMLFGIFFTVWLGIYISIKAPKIGLKKFSRYQTLVDGLKEKST